MSETSTAVTKQSKETEFVPFGAKESIRLSIALVQNSLAVKTKSGKSCSENDAIKFIMMCKARGLNPWEGDAFLIGYDSRDGATFSLITAHQAFLKRAELHPEYDGMQSGIIIQTQDGQLKEVEGDFHLKESVVVGGWCKVFFKNRSHPMYKRIRLERFQKAFGVWQDDPAGMICKCAEADALRSSFPTMLGGLYLKEEMRDESTAVSSPIFTEPAKEVQLPEKEVAEAEVVPEPEPEPVKKKAAPVIKPPDGRGAMLLQLREYLDESGLTEGRLMRFLVGSGACEEGQLTDNIDTDVLEMVLNSHEDIFDKVKATTK